MKRILTMMLALVLALSLTACGKEELPAPYTVDTAAAFAQAEVFSEELEELDGDTAFALYRLADYGLDREDLTETAVLRSSGATCEECAVLIFADAEQAAQGEAALKDYVQAQLEANADYRPQEVPKLEKALIDRVDNTLLLLVASNADTVKTAIA